MKVSISDVNFITRVTIKAETDHSLHLVTVWKKAGDISKNTMHSLTQCWLNILSMQRFSLLHSHSHQTWVTCILPPMLLSWWGGFVNSGHWNNFGTMFVFPALDGLLGFSGRWFYVPMHTTPHRYILIDLCCVVNHGRGFLMTKWIINSNVLQYIIMSHLHSKH